MPILQMILLSITEVPKNEASVFFSGFTLLTESAPGPSFPQAEPFLRLFLDLRYGPVGRTVSSWAHHEPRRAGVHLTPALAAAFAQWGYIFNFLVSHSLRLQTGTVSFVIYFTWWPGGSLTMTRGGILWPWETLPLNWYGREGQGGTEVSVQESGLGHFGWYHLHLVDFGFVIWKMTKFLSLKELLFSALIEA